LPLNDARRERYIGDNAELAEKGMRVLAVGSQGSRTTSRAPRT
jgi:hypothetical protein